MKPSYRTLVWRGDSVKKEKQQQKNQTEQKNDTAFSSWGTWRFLWWDQIKNKRERMLFLTNGFHFEHAKNSGSQETRGKVLQENPFLLIVVLVYLSGKQQSTSKHSVFQQVM